MAKRHVKFAPPTVSPRASGGWYYYMSQQWANLFEALIIPLADNYRWTWDEPEKTEQAKWWSQQIERFKLDELCPPCTGGGGGGGGVVGLPDCITISPDGLTVDINLVECTEMVVNIYQGCGCGCGGGSGLSAGDAGRAAGVGAGSALSWIAELDVPVSSVVNEATDCDIVTGGFLDYVLDQQKEMFQAIADNGGIVEAGIDGLAALIETVTGGFITSEGVDWLTSITTEAAGNIVTYWNDTDFRQRYKEAWIRTYPNHGAWTSVTRNDLFAVGNKLQNVAFQGAVPYPVKTIYNNAVRLQNMNKLNRNLGRFIGDCDSNDYGWLYQNTGTGFLLPPPPDTFTEPLPYEFTWHYIFDTDRAEGQYGNMGISNAPSTGLSRYITGQGYISKNTGGHQTYNGFQFDEPLWVSAIRWTVTEIMDGDRNQVKVWNKATEEVFTDTEGNIGFLEHLYVFDEPTLVSRLDVLMRENATTTIVYGGEIHEVELWGINTPPSEGIPVE